MNQHKLVGLVLIFSAFIDVVIALVVVPADLRWVFYASALILAALGVWFFLRGLNQPAK